MLLNERFPELLDAVSREADRVEVTVDAAGGIAVNGWAETDALDALLASVTSPQPRRASTQGLSPGGGPAATRREELRGRPKP